MNNIISSVLTFISSLPVSSAAVVLFIIGVFVTAVLAAVIIAAVRKKSASAYEGEEEQEQPDNTAETAVESNRQTPKNGDGLHNIISFVINEEKTSGIALGCKKKTGEIFVCFRSPELKPFFKDFYEILKLYRSNEISEELYNAFVAEKLKDSSVLKKYDTNQKPAEDVQTTDKICFENC